MDSKHLEFETYYKNLEKELNRRIHNYTNCHTFTLAFGKALEIHLDHILTSRNMVTQWLSILNIPDKDAYAVIAVKKVDYEGKIDHLEDTMFLLNKILQENHLQMRVLGESLKELVNVFGPEIKHLQENKMCSLKRELDSLKLLFNDDQEEI
nr:hypothetical protein [Neobacillus sp. Marseille-Q6967]